MVSDVMPGHLAGEERREEARRREEKRGEEKKRRLQAGGLQADQHSRAACVIKLLWRTGTGTPVSRTRRRAFLVLGAWHDAWYLLDSTTVMAIMIIATQQPPTYRVAKNTSLGSLLPATGTGL